MQLNPLLKLALASGEKQKGSEEEDVIELGVTAEGIALAADLLAQSFTLVTTNVPYLGRPKQNSILSGFCDACTPKRELIWLLVLWNVV